MFNIRKIIFIIYYLLFISFESEAQSIKFLPFNKLEIKDGLPGINVRKIARDKYGFMWFATQDGISRFDGKSFINLNSYNVDAKRKIIGTDVYDIKTDVSGNYLWTLSPYGGVSKIDLQTCNVTATWEIKQTIKKDTSLWYKCFYDNGRYLVIGTNEGIISYFNKASGIVEASFSLAHRFNSPGDLEDIFIDEQKRAWFFISGKGILITDSTLTRQIELLNFPGKDANPFTFTDYAFFQQKLFITTTSGLEIFDIKTLKPQSDSLEKKYLSYCRNKELHCIAIEGNHAVIAGKNLVYRINLLDGEVENLRLSGNVEDQSWLTLTNSIYADKNSVWLGSQYGVGVIRNIHSPFVSYYTSKNGDNLKINHAITIYAASDSSVLVCGDDGLFMVDPHTGFIRKFAVDDFFYSVFRASKDYFIASGVTKGLQVFDSRFHLLKIESVFPELIGIKNELLMCSANMGDSILYMASQNKNGLYIWNVKTKEIKTISTRSAPLSLKNDNINRLFIDSKNRLWIVCENIISIYDYFAGKIFHLPLKDPLTNTPLSINMDVCETPESFWITSYGTGVVELSKEFVIKKIYAAREGIKNLGLYKIFSANDSTLLVTSNNGLIEINSRSGFVKNYYTEDGLQSNSFEEASGDKKGNIIYVGGIKGITKIDLAKLTSIPQVPRISFSTIELFSRNSITDTLNVIIKKLLIQQDITQLSIGFSAIDYLEPEKLMFAYKIKERDKKWNFTDKNYIQFFRLNPGTYHLQVQAINGNQVASEILELELVFLPKWYEAWWFKMVVILFITGIVYILYRYRLSQIRKQEKIRRQISADLHDDIGSTLNSVKVFSNLALLNPAKQEYLVQVKDGTQSAITGIRDIMWVLDDKQDTIADLINRFEQFAGPLAEANKTKLEKSIDSELSYRQLKKEEKRNLFLILKEAFNNCIKYSHCSSFSYMIDIVKAKKLRLQIKDNGNGFDLNKIGEGYGLKNMKQRAEQIGYTFNIESSSDNGTIIQVQEN